MKKFCLIAVLLFLSDFAGVCCQKLYDGSNQVWLGNALTFGIIDDLDFEMTNFLRMDITNVLPDKSFLQFGSGYKFLEYFKISAYLRLLNNQPQWESDYFANFQISIPVSDFSFKLRTRYQNKDNIERLKEVVRERFLIEFDFVKDISLESSAELFYDMSNSRNDRVRYLIGINAKIAKRHELEIGYIYDNQLNRKSPESRNIITVSLNIRVM